MKKINYLLMALFTTALFSCNINEEDYFQEIETVLEIPIPISSANSEELKSETDLLNDEIPFSGLNDFRLRDMTSTSGVTSKIHRINPVGGAILSISNVKEEYIISSLMLHWGYKISNVEDFTMMESIDLLSLNHTLVNEILQIELDGIANQLVAEIKDSEILLRFNITGNCNSNFNSIANYQIPVIIESEYNSTRFELF